MLILVDTPVVWNPTAWGWPYVGMQIIMRVMFDACLVTDGDSSSDWWDQIFREAWKPNLRSTLDWHHKKYLVQYSHLLSLSGRRTHVTVQAPSTSRIY